MRPCGAASDLGSGGGFEGGGRLGGLLLPGAAESGKDPDQKRPRTCSAVPFSYIFWGGRCTPEASHVQVSEKTALPQKKSTAPPGLRAIDVRCVLAGSGSVGDSELRGGGLEGLGASVRSSECYDYHRPGSHALGRKLNNGQGWRQRTRKTGRTLRYVLHVVKREKQLRSRDGCKIVIGGFFALCVAFLGKATLDVCLDNPLHKRGAMWLPKNILNIAVHQSP